MLVQRETVVANSFIDNYGLVNWSGGETGWMYVYDHSAHAVIDSLYFARIFSGTVMR